MKKKRSFLKVVYYRIWLGLLTLFWITTVFPVTAYPNLKSSLKKQNISTVERIYQSNSNLLDKGRELYEAGRYSDAIVAWQQALKEFQARGLSLQVAQSMNYLSNAYRELGQWEQAKTAIAQSLKILQTHPNSAILAQALNAQGSLQLAIGQPEIAFNTWQHAEKIYTEIKDKIGILGSQINQFQALHQLGLYYRAKKILEQLKVKLQALPETSLKVVGLRSLGIALHSVGDLTQAQQFLEQSLEIAQRLQNPSEIGITFLSLGNTLRSLKNYSEALKNYQKVLEYDEPNSLITLETRINQLNLLLETKQLTKIQILLSQIYFQLAKTSYSREVVYLRVKLAKILINLQVQYPSMVTVKEIGKNLGKAIQSARKLQDSRAEAYALGELGYLYIQTQQWEEAQDLTQQALTIAQSINLTEAIAHLQGQLGQILKQRGKFSDAIVAYTQAVKILKLLRQDLAAINSDIQFSFRESTEPIYRELVGLLLQSNASQTNLQQAREVIEDLRLAELDNFFREACLETKQQQIDEIDSQAAIIYPIILSDRLEVVLSLSGKFFKNYTTMLPQNNIEKIFEQLLESLNPFFSSDERLRLSQEVYNWLIKPIEAELSANKIETLVFVLDDSIRNLPMAALYDGKQYLVEKYNIALAPSLHMVGSRSLTQQKVKVLTGGISQAHLGFSALPGVKKEVIEIVSELPSKVLLDREFTIKNLQQQIKTLSFPIIHLATHGQFSSRLEETFILSWNNKINAKEFENIIRHTEHENSKVIELLVLSACQTATGDKRAALGLAGIAIKSGARTTLGTLWSVKDESTAKLMGQFYQQISQQVGKAKALRAAQLTLLKNSKYAHPYYWSPFVLIGYWL